MLVGCAGGNRPRPFLELDGDDLDWAWRVNVPALPAQAAARRMVARGRGGAIVTVTSQMGHVGGRGRTAYCAAKHAVEGASKAMALELAPARHPGQHGRADVRGDADDAPVPRRRGVRADVLAGSRSGGSARRRRWRPRSSFAASPAARADDRRVPRVDGGWTAQ